VDGKIWGTPASKHKAIGMLLRRGYQEILRSAMRSVGNQPEQQRTRCLMLKIRHSEKFSFFQYAS
jgi:hypothetical protein